MKLDCRRPGTASWLTKENRVVRLHFARNHKKQVWEDQKNVFFTNETIVSQMVLWKYVEVQERSFLLAISLHSAVALQCSWVAFPLTHSQNYLTHFGPLVVHRFLFMDHNARAYVAREVYDFLNQAGILIMQWPPERSALSR